MVAKRWDILIDLLSDRKHTAGAEIGVFEGDTTVHLLRRLPGLKSLICVDPWEHYPEHTETLNPNKPKFHDADFNVVESKFKSRIDNRVTILKMYSNQAGAEVPDESLDFVFIDANHAYKYVYNDIKIWSPKVKPGGLIMGHDYKVKGARRNFGVTEAVVELFAAKHKSKRHVWYAIRENKLPW